MTARHPMLLFVDDDDNWTFFVEREFRKLAPTWRFQRAANGIEALRRLEDSVPPAALITDLQMPGMDGATLIETLKNNRETRTFPVIVLSSCGDPVTRQKCVGLGVDSFLDKPNPGKDLGAVLQYVLKLAYDYHLSRGERDSFLFPDNG